MTRSREIFTLTVKEFPPKLYAAFWLVHTQSIPIVITSYLTHALYRETLPLISRLYRPVSRPIRTGYRPLYRADIAADSWSVSVKYRSLYCGQYRPRTDIFPTLGRHSTDIPLRLYRPISQLIQAEYRPLYRTLYRPICRSTLDRHVSVDSIGRGRPIVNMIRIFLDREPVRAREKHYSLVSYMLINNYSLKWRWIVKVIIYTSH